MQPDAQEDVLEYIDVYNSGTAHPAGFHFAINVDIAMFDVYSRGASGRSINAPVSNTGGRRAPTVDMLQRAAAAAAAAANESDLASHGDSFCAVSYYTSSSGADAVSYSVFCASRAQDESSFPSDFEVVSQGNLPDSASSWLFPSSADREQGLRAASVSGDDALILSPRGAFAIHAAVGSEGGVSLGLFPAADAVYFDVLYGQCTSFLPLFGETVKAVDESACAVVLSGEVTGTKLRVDLFELMPAEGSVGTNPLGSLFADASDLLGDGASASTASSARLGVRVPAGSEGDALLLLFLSVNDVIFGTASVEDEAPWVAVSTGRYFDVSATDGALMLVTDYGYCFNSHTHNTRSAPSVCQQAARPTRTVLDYSMGLFEDWLEVLRESKCACINASNCGDLCTEVTSCHLRIMHGTYDQGTRPAVAMASGHTGDGGGVYYFFMEVHEGFSEFDREALSRRGRSDPDNGCGIPLAHDELVVDSFELNHWLEALSLKS